jgi:hypothetical protein
LNSVRSSIGWSTTLEKPPIFPSAALETKARKRITIADRRIPFPRNFCVLFHSAVIHQTVSVKSNPYADMHPLIALPPPVSILSGVLTIGVALNQHKEVNDEIQIPSRRDH